ncbi:MAG: type I phosphomannose isomerase catalytic subunit [Thermomicrobiales bacterium]
MPGLSGLRLLPAYHERVWGGQRLRPSTAGATPVGEAWIVYEENRVAGGPLAGQTLANVAARYGEALLGRVPLARTGTRFPLLIKLLDTAGWLSVQVHPNDEQAARLAGVGNFGKTEAWHILDTDPGAQLICGLRPGTSAADFAAAVRAGTIADLAQHLTVAPGDTVFIAAGTIHALGPGLLLYEVQQTSDITYRVFDWNRPQTAGRALHIEQSLAVADPQATGQASHLPPLAAGQPTTLTTCPYFTLATVAGDSAPIALDTRGDSFHALTVVAGAAEVRGDGWRETIGRFETVVVPAAGGAYAIVPQGACRLLIASVV